MSTVPAHVEALLEDGRTVKIDIINPRHYGDWKKLTKLRFKLAALMSREDKNNYEMIFDAYELLVDELYTDLSETFGIDNWYQPGIPIPDIVMYTYRLWTEVFTPSSPAKNNREAKPALSVLTGEKCHGKRVLIHRNSFYNSF